MSPSGRDFEAELQGFLREWVDRLLEGQHDWASLMGPPRHVNCRCVLDPGEPGGDHTATIEMTLALVHFECAFPRAIVVRSFVDQTWRCSACDRLWSALDVARARSPETVGIRIETVPTALASEAEEERLAALVGLRREGPEPFPVVPVERPPIGPMPAHLRRELRNRVLEIPTGQNRVAPPSERLPYYRPR